MKESVGNRSETILLLEDDLETRRLVSLALRCEGYSLLHAETADAALRIVRGEEVSLVLIDARIPEEALDTLRRIRQVNTELPVIVLSENRSTMMVVDAIKNGANDFLPMPVERTDLIAAIDKHLAGVIRPHVSHQPNPAFATSEPLLEGAFMRKFRLFLRQISASDAPLLIQGETGVGKEIITGLVHAHSLRANKPFLKVNCAALPSELVESELFGYEKGAFTGAFKNKPGKFDLADTGMILLDEIGDMDFKLQAKLLQVVQDRRFERLGGEETISVDVRVVAATHCDLEKAIDEGRFREDLYHRLNVIGIVVPPLRERGDEILPLTRAFIKKYSPAGLELPQITSALQRELLAYEWPGNIRELENAVRKFCVFRDPDMMINDLHDRARRRKNLHAVSAPAVKAAPESNLAPPLEKLNLAQKQIETETIVRTLQSTRWNRKQAAALLRVDYKVLLYKMKKLGIDEDPASGGRAPAADIANGEELSSQFSELAYNDGRLRATAIERG